jgi:hypothetical protein
MFNAQELRRQLYRSRHQNLMHWIQVPSSAQRNARCGEPFDELIEV